MATAPGIIEQTLTAGNQWNEALPASTPADANGIRQYPADPAGGLFQPDFAAEDGAFETWVIESLLVNFADAASSEVAVVNSDAVPKRVVLFSPGGGTFSRVDPIVLAWDEKLVLKSTGATLEMYARVNARPGRLRPAS